MEMGLKGLAVFLLFALIGLNGLSYSGTKVVALLLVLVLLLLVVFISIH